MRAGHGSGTSIRPTAPERRRRSPCCARPKDRCPARQHGSYCPARGSPKFPQKPSALPDQTRRGSMLHAPPSAMRYSRTGRRGLGASADRLQAANCELRTANRVAKAELTFDIVDPALGDLGVAHVQCGWLQGGRALTPHLLSLPWFPAFAGLVETFKPRSNTRRCQPPRVIPKVQNSPPSVRLQS